MSRLRAALYLQELPHRRQLALVKLQEDVYKRLKRMSKFTIHVRQQVPSAGQRRMIIRLFSRGTDE
jgi:hypothetical protein